MAGQGGPRALSVVMGSQAPVPRPPRTHHITSGHCSQCSGLLSVTGRQKGTPRRPLGQCDFRQHRTGEAHERVDGQGEVWGWDPCARPSRGGTGEGAATEGPAGACTSRRLLHAEEPGQPSCGLWHWPCLFRHDLGWGSFQPHLGSRSGSGWRVMGTRPAHSSSGRGMGRPA